MLDTAAQLEHPFMEKYHGRLEGILQWEQLDELWETVQRGNPNDWFIYHIGDPPPITTCTSDHFHRFVEELDKLIRHEHQERYCGIVYTDDKSKPNFVKIYDPNNLGHVCGSNGSPPPLPGWILSKLQPIDLEVAMQPTGSRKRWWQRIFE